MLYIYLVYTKPYAALASRIGQILQPKIRKLWKYYLLTDYIQDRDQKSEKFEWIRKNVSGGNSNTFYYNKCNKSKLVRGNPFKNKGSAYIRTPKFFEAYASGNAKIYAFVEP